jgi:hypothetical protein
MKPLLRAVLVVDAGLYLSSGAVLLLTPLAGLQRALQITTIEPAMVGQMLGLALLGLAWLSLRGAIDGAMTIGVAKIVGHVTWLAGALVIAWTIGPHTLWLPALGIVPNLLIGGLLIVVGLGGARFASAVRKREIARGAQSAGAKARGTSVPASGPQAAPRPSTSTPAEPVLGSPEPARGIAGGSVASPHVLPDERLQPGDRTTSAASSARAGAASGNDDVRQAQPTAAPRPPFHG